jgi:PilZ domain-containing protein
LQRLKEGQSVLVMVQEKMALCTLTGFSDGAAVFLIGKRQHGGPMPEHAPDAQITFESGPNLVMLNGVLERRGGDELLFSVSDGVQVPPRRRDSRLRTRLPVRIRVPSGEEREGFTADLSATGMGLEGTDHAQPGQQLGIRLELPDGTTVVATTSVVRIAGPVTALKIETFEEGSRDRLSDYVLACNRGDAVGSSATPADPSSNPS